MKIRFECPNCHDTLEIEFAVQRGDNSREYPILQSVRAIWNPPPQMSELAARVLMNQCKRQEPHYRAGVEAKLSMGKVRKQG